MSNDLFVAQTPCPYTHAFQVFAICNFYQIHSDTSLVFELHVLKNWTVTVQNACDAHHGSNPDI